MERDKIITISVIIILILLAAAFVFSIPKPYDESRLENNTVVRIIDGDTFEYYNSDENKVLKVRLLCVDAPERNEDGYDEAKNYLRSLIMYQEVNLISSITDKDKYGRLLRYVYVNDMGEILFVNRLMLENNYAELMIVSPEKCEEVQ